MRKNLWVIEYWYDMDNKSFLGESGYYETFTNNLEELHKAYMSENDSSYNIYEDEKETVQVGWDFTKQEKYEDSERKYSKSQVVYVFKKKPRVITSVESENAFNEQ